MVQIERQGFGDNGYDGSILFERKIITERIEGVCIRHMVGQQPDGVAWRERMAAARPDLNDEFAKITAPAAVICGEEDPSSAPAVMRPLAERMVNTTVVMTEIEDCGHFSAWERPETVARALHELVSRVPAAAGADPAAADAAIAAREA